MDSNLHPIRSATAAAFSGLGMLLSISFASIPLVEVMPVGFLQVFALPGRFLLASFHAAALFVPAYVLIAAALVRRRGGTAAILALNLAILPFLTSAVALRLAFDVRVMASPITASVSGMFGRVPGALTFALLTAVLCLLIVVVTRIWVRLDRERLSSSLSAADAGTSERQPSGVVLELPPPAAAYAWKHTPRGKRRHAECEADGSGAPLSDFDSVESPDGPDEAEDELPPVIAAGNASQDSSSDPDDTQPEDTHPGELLRGLHIEWPSNRARVRFDDDETDAEGDVARPDTTAERGDYIVRDNEYIVRNKAGRSGSDKDDPDTSELVVEFTGGRFRSLGRDEEAEIRIGYDELNGGRTEAASSVEDHDELNGASTEAAPDVAEYDDYDDVDVWESDLDDEGEAVGRHAGVDDEEFAEGVYDESAELEEIGDSVDEHSDDAKQADAAADAAPPRRGPGRKAGHVSRYNVPVDGLLEEYPHERYWELDERTKADGETLRYTLQEFGIEAEVTGIRKGPVITMFEILPAPGVKLTKIVNLADNIALRLAAQTVRIVAPIPGKHAVGIEVPNKRRAIVSFADLVQNRSFNDKEHLIPLAMGKDIPGDAQIIDLTKTPHLLIAGATGSGKSVCVNSIICSVLYRRAPQDVKMILIDPKIVELKFYNDIPHLLTPVITEPKRAFQALQYALYEMERRYSLLDSLQVRDIASYNQKVKARKLAVEKLPYIVIVVDEFADLMATSGKELESTLARLAAMSRAVGIHLVLATQRPSTDVITGLIKANIPSRIAFMVASKVDSRIILDSQGAEKLLGRGDMLFTSAWDPVPTRMQGAFLSEDEVERVVAHVKTLGEPDYIDEEIFIDDDDDPDLQEDLEDPLLEKAIAVVQQSRKASASYLQRRLKVGYNRAARMVEEMERLGIVGPANGSKPREILRGEAVGVGEQ